MTRLGKGRVLSLASEMGLTIGNAPDTKGSLIAVEIDAHFPSLIEFESGVIGQMIMSLDVWDSETPRFEIYGEEGTICIPDPDPVHGANIIHGEVWVRTRNTARWTHRPRPTGREHWKVGGNPHGFSYDARGPGLLDLAYAVRNSRSPRASGEMAFHVCEAMAGISRCVRPEPLPENFPEGEVGCELAAVRSNRAGTAWEPVGKKENAGDCACPSR